jgi:hypothetical protein
VTLAEVSPRLRALENPFLRRTLGRVATLRHVAKAGGVTVSVLVDRLRAHAGLPPSQALEQEPAVAGPRPAWARPEAVTRRRDARPDVTAGLHPLPLVVEDLERLGAEDVYELLTPLVPAPLIELARKKGFDSYPVTAGDETFVRTFFRRAAHP